MNTWLQNSDFSSIDIDHLRNYASFECFIDSFDTSKLDATMRKLEESKQESCPWGIGVNMDTDYGLHVCREDIDTDTYFVTFQNLKRQKFLGFIPITKDQGYIKEGLSFSDMKKEAMLYYESLKK